MAEFGSGALLGFEVSPPALLNAEEVIKDAICNEFPHVGITVGHHDQTIALRRYHHHEGHKGGHGARVIEDLVALKHPRHPPQPVRNRAHEHVLVEVMKRPRILELTVARLGDWARLGHHHAEVLRVVQHVRDDSTAALIGPDRNAGEPRRLPDVAAGAVDPPVAIGQLEPTGPKQRVPVPEEGLLHAHGAPQVPVEELTQAGPGQGRDEVARRGPHQVVVLEGGPRLGGHGEVAQAADDPPRAAGADGQVVPRVPRAVAEGVLDRDVRRRPVVAQHEILAQQLRHGRRPPDRRVVRRVVDQQRQRGCRVGLCGAACPEEGVRRHWG